MYILGFHFINDDPDSAKQTFSVFILIFFCIIHRRMAKNMIQQQEKICPWMAGGRYKMKTFSSRRIV